MDDGPQTQFRGVTGDLPIRVDVAESITPENFEREREKIFRRAWVPIGHTEDLPE